MIARRSSPSHSGIDRDPPPAVGTRIAGRYVVSKLLDSGAMGHVVAARHELLGHEVAIKVIKREVAKRHEMVERFVREARTMASLQHDNIVRALDCGTLPDGTPYVVMELLSGRTLREELHRRGALPIEEAVDFVIQACDGLAAAHAQGIVHRDLKPSNLFLTGATVKILDFGISKLPKATEHELSLTDTSVVLGSPSYMSPEQVRLSKAVDERADIWGLGVVLYTLLTGELPFEAEGFSAICAAVVADTPVPLRGRRPEVPEGLAAVVGRCLEKSAEWRFKDAPSLARALSLFASDRGRAIAAALSERRPRVPSLYEIARGEDERTEATSVVASRVAAAEPRGRRWLTVAGLGVVVAVVAVVALVAQGRGKPAASAGDVPSASVPLVVHPSAPPSVASSAPSARPSASVAPPLATVPRRVLKPHSTAVPASSPRPHGTTFGGSALDDHN